MDDPLLAPRLRSLPFATVLGHEVRVAEGVRARFLGLAHLDREAVGGGLLVPRCSSVHTFGMRFPLDLLLLDDEGRLAGVRREIPARRVVLGRGAKAILEIPSLSDGH